MRSLILAAFSMLLLSCAMGPNYSRPDIPTSDSFRMAEEPKDLPSLANMPWWELYQDEELQRLIRIALEETRISNERSQVSTNSRRACSRLEWTLPLN